MGYIQAISLLYIAVTATAVVLTRDPRRQVFVAGFYGIGLTIAFFAVQSADVALSELVTTTVALPALILMSLRKVRMQQEELDAQGGAPAASQESGGERS